MRNNPLDDIIKCNIEISAPGSSDVSFDSILLVVPGPTGTGEKTMTAVTPISRADDLKDYGFTAEDPAYVAASVAFAQSPAPSELLICIRKITSQEGATPVTFEAIDVTLSRAAKEGSWYGFHLTGFRETADITKAVSWAEANEKLFGFEYTDVDAFPVKNTNFYRTYAIFAGLADGYGEEQPPENEYAALAEMAKCFGYDPGTETWHMKTLATIVPSALDAAQKKALEEKNITTFLRYAGSNVTIGGKTLAGEWIDVIRFRDWLKAEMQLNVFNAIKVNRKVPYTDAGIGMIEGKMIETLTKGQDIGGIAPTQYDADDNAVPGFTVTVPISTSLSETERKSRRLTGCKYTARLSGAIHLVEIEGFLTF